MLQASPLLETDKTSSEAKKTMLVVVIIIDGRKILIV
jgi:hypothetical protein